VRDVFLLLDDISGGGGRCQRQMRAVSSVF
jgi:hypothetical protein